LHEEQQEVVAFLSDPSAYGTRVERVETIATHASLVFIAGEHAYKLKRAVKYPYLDFSTAELRRQACEAELALNRRTAPALYLEVRGLFRSTEGGISFAGTGPAIDWVVVMRRFDQELVFDALATTGRLSPQLMDELADHIASFHAGAERRYDRGGAADMAEIAEMQHRCLLAARHVGLDAKRIDGALREWRNRLAGLAELLDRRRAAGKVRHCHGDLHLRNICLFEGKPTLFDCLEFSDALATTDVLYDLAFLLMDLEHRGLAHFANRVSNRYLDRSGEDDGLAAMPLFLSLRAAIRSHVVASAMERAAGGAPADLAAEARQYLDLAHRFLQPQPCRLIAIGGVSGTGKSTLAAGLAPELGPPPGTRVLRSDVTRKLLLGVAPETRLAPEAYTREISQRVYDAMRQKAATVLAAGYPVIIDAVALMPEERRFFAETARAAGVPFTGLWLEGGTETLAGRLRARRGDASDATPEVLAQQLRQDPGTIDWIRIDATAGREACLAAARRALAIGEAASY
jgi:aminoglycoside phosphotransferase family enzyme/predicted kinase